MPGQFLTTAERERMNKFPQEIPKEDIYTFFTLTPSDLSQIPIRSANYNRLGFALQLCALRYLGFYPDELTTAPSSVIVYTTNQLGIDSPSLEAYAQRPQTRTDHLLKIQEYLGFRRASDLDLAKLSEWLLKRALEHDKPTLLYHLACQRLYSEKIVRPGVTTLERMVIQARQESQEETYRQLNFLMGDDLKAFLDKILIKDENLGRTPLFWLRHGATANTPKNILEAIEKLDFLRESFVDKWDLSSLNPNRQKFLAQIGRSATNQALQRMSEQRRYPILLAFLRQSLIDIIDELIELFDHCLWDTYTRARRENQEFRLSIAKTTNEKLLLFQEIGRILLDKTVSDFHLRSTIYSKIPEEELRASVEECDQLIRPLDDQSSDYFASRYSYIREFAPKFLDALKFQSNKADDQLIKALELIKTLNATRKRKVPEDAPLAFIPQSWLDYVLDEKDRIVRRYYELSALWELRGALRSGDIWVKNSRKYANPETYLIPKDQWPKLRFEALRLLGLPAGGEERLNQRKAQLQRALSQLDKKLSDNDDVKVERVPNIGTLPRLIENRKLVISPLQAEDLPQSSLELKELIAQRLPWVDLTDLLIEVDGWTHFTDCFEHPSGHLPKTEDLLTQLYASILANACNFGLVKMAQISDLTYDQLAWCNNWYIREDTLQAAIDKLVNFQYSQTLSHIWGGGMMSSSDGQRFPVAVKSRIATANPRYFGYGKGLTFYSWTSDQFSQYGSRVIPTTIRDATYVLDAILDNETELEIIEHTTDTAGYTELVFALFDLLGMQFSPRIRDIGDQKIYRIDKTEHYKHLNPVLKRTIKPEKILKSWDDILRVVASIKLGWVTASLFISKLQSYPRKNVLTKAIQEYGRLIKSIYIPNYLCDSDLQRRVGAQLNKGESIHKLRRFLLFANEGKIRKSQIEDIANQASALTLVTNAVIVWNIRYIKAIIDQLQQGGESSDSRNTTAFKGYTVLESDLIHLSPCRFDHINKYGKYFFNVDKELNRKQLRPLRHTKD